MNMLRDEDNAKYRSVIKNTLEFEPEILKRFVSFMNNPDEETAVAQFGKGDKYFGICTLMATLPGLPMFGHGQIEGYAEKYGMEYRRAYWDERPDGYLVDRHRREIFPLLHRRHLFADVHDFRLYDFYIGDGVNEDVFAYSNRAGDQRALVVYHNRYATARGWIRTAAAQLVKDGEGGERVLAQTSLGEGLGLRGDGNYFYIFRDSITGLEYIRNGRGLHEDGLYVELEAYKCHAFLDWREVQDNEWHQYAHLADYLGGRGVPSIEEALREVFLQPVHYPFKELVNGGSLRRLMDNRVSDPDTPDGAQTMASLLEAMEGKVLHLLQEMVQFTGSDQERAAGAGAAGARGARAEAVTEEVRRKLEAGLHLPVLESRFPMPKSRAYKTAAQMVRSGLDGDPAAWGTLLGWVFTHALGKIVSEEDYAAQSRTWMDEWLLGKIVAGALQDLGLDEAAARWAVATDKVLINHQDWFELAAAEEDRAYQVLVSWLRDSEVQQLLRVNRYGGVLWFNREAFDQLLGWMLTIATVSITADAERTRGEVARDVAGCFKVIRVLRQAGESSEFQVVKLMEAARA
jgi:hypothetical protein